MANSINKVAKPWTSKSIGSTFQHNVFYLLIRMRAGWIIFTLLRLVVIYYVLLRPSVRTRSGYYLSRRFPTARGARGLWNTCLMDRNMGQTLIDRATVGIVGTDAVRVDFPDRERLRKLVREGKGLILMTGHVGGWQVVMYELRFLKLPVNLLLHRDQGDVDRLYFEHQGTAEAPFRIIDPAEELGGMLRMLEVLKRGEVLCIMGDRVFGSAKNTVPVRFLGGEIRIPFSAFKIASATGTPIAVILSFRKGRGLYEMTLDRVIRVPLGLGRGGNEFARYAREFVEGLEKFVMIHPFQFFNFFNMWENK